MLQVNTSEQKSKREKCFCRFGTGTAIKYNFCINKMTVQSSLFRHDRIT